MKLIVASDGTIEYLGTGNVELTGVELVTVFRASHIEPVNGLVRRLFHWLRVRYGDESRVAAFTRCWPVLWRVNLSPVGGPIFGRFIGRSEAIEAEEQWLCDNYWGGLHEGE